jgi:hypothetical protein
MKVAYATALLTATLISAAWAQENTTPPKQKSAGGLADEIKSNDVAGLMQLKLRYVQKVLEGVALEDFDEIAKSAEMLGLLTQDEHWQVYQTVEYRQRSAEFQRVSDELAKAAKRQNIDAAALSYLQLTMSCVNCHKHTRSIQKGTK